MATPFRHLALCLMIVAWPWGDLVALADDDDRPGEQAKMEVLFQELFLGQMVYPQEKGEIQFTTGFFSAVERNQGSRLPVVIEYGITDRLQVAVGVPIDFKRSQETADGVGNIELEGFWNFYNNPTSGWAYGVGLGLGLPNATLDVGDRALIYEPFVVACRQYDSLGFNASAGLEVKDYLDAGQSTEVKGDVALAAFRRLDRFIPLIELSMEIEQPQTAVRLAPGLYWHPSWTPAEIGVSLPIGLTAAAPDFAVFLLVTMEFPSRKRNRAGDGDDKHDDDNDSEGQRREAAGTGLATALPQSGSSRVP